jgi:thiamine biosynthesis lipoprotein
MSRTGAAMGALAAGLLLAPACTSPAPGPAGARLVERAALAMGSELRVGLWTPDEAGAEAACDAVFAEFDRLDGLMSVWREGSDVRRINEAAGVRPVPAAPEVREVLRTARQAGEWTGGKFDVTFGALADLWKFDHDQDDRVPAPEAVRARLPLVDYTAVEVDDRAGTVFLARKGMRIHLGGIGKGYAVDRAAAILRARGFHDFVIQSGGDLYAAGRRGDRPWQLGINDPRGPGGQSFATVELSDRTLSTSGDYERFFVKDGRRYHHLLDPDTGESARGCRSVSIVATSAMLADALSTGVFILGPRDGMALIERLPDVEGVIVTASNDVLVSSGLRDRLVILVPPSDGR